MKTIQDYPVSFGYLATTTINGKPYTHRGLDRAAPCGTPVVIGGVTIGLVGTTGLSTGCHLHTQAGHDAATQNTINPSGHEFQAGTVTNRRLTDSGSWGKFVTIRNNSGVYVTYAHLSQVNVTVGQKIGGSKLMDSDAKVRAQYYTLRGSEGTAAERRGWVGRSYEEFNATARPEVQGRTANINNLTNAVVSLTKERDEARRTVATLTRELLEERDRIKVLEGQVNTLNAELQGAKEAYKELEAQHQAHIKELEEQIAIKDEEIARLNKELSNCDKGDCEDLSGWGLIALGIKKLLGKE